MDEAGAIAHLESYTEVLSNDDFDDDEGTVPIVDEHMVATVISEWASIPLGKLESSEMDRLVQLEDDMRTRVKGQDRAIQSVARAVRRARSGLRDPQRPIASFLFCGPTGTGRFYLFSLDHIYLSDLTAPQTFAFILLYHQAKLNYVKHSRKLILDQKKT
jgi:ATP-dependent Clp protease ATP-binding subunit ClpC